MSNRSANTSPISSLKRFTPPSPLVVRQKAADRHRRRAASFDDLLGDPHGFAQHNRDTLPSPTAYVDAILAHDLQAVLIRWVLFRVRVILLAHVAAGSPPNGSGTLKLIPSSIWAQTLGGAGWAGLASQTVTWSVDLSLCRLHEIEGVDTGVVEDQNVRDVFGLELERGVVGLATNLSVLLKATCVMDTRHRAQLESVAF